MNTSATREGGGKGARSVGDVQLVGPGTKAQQRIESARGGGDQEEQSSEGGGGLLEVPARESRGALPRTGVTGISQVAGAVEGRMQ